MNTDTSFLFHILAPPKVPIDAPSADDWQNFESQLSTSLPSDFKALISGYGIGDIDGFLRLLSPISSKLDYNLNEIIRDANDTLQVFKNEEEHSQKIFPEKGGVLPWGTTINGDTLHWRTIGAPHEWTVVVNPSRTLDFVEFLETTSSFLTGILTRRILTDIFPWNFPSSELQFIPPEISSSERKLS